MRENLINVLWAIARHRDLAATILSFEQVSATFVGEPPPLTAWNALLFAAVMKGDGAHDAVESILRKMAENDFGLGDSTTVHLRLLHTLAAGGRGGWKTGTTQLGAASKAGIVVSPFTYAALIQAMCEARALSEAVALFSMLPSTATSSPPVHQALMLGSLRAHAPRQALIVWEQYVQHQQHNSSSSSNVKRPTIQMCNFALEACGKLVEAEPKWVQAATDVLSSMRGWGMVPNEVTFGFYVDLLIHAGKLDEAEGIPEQAASFGVKIGAGIYTKLAAGLVKVGEHNRALQTFRRMLAAGLQPTAVTYTVMLSACAKTGRMGQASKLLHRMDRAHVLPNVFTCNALLHGLLRRGRRDLAARLTGACMPSLGVQPDGVTVRILALEAAYAHDFTGALDTLV